MIQWSVDEKNSVASDRFSKAFHSKQKISKREREEISLDTTLSNHCCQINQNAVAGKIKGGS